MYPQMMAAAARLAPLLSRMGSRFAGSLGSPMGRFQMIQTPDVSAVSPVPPQGAPAGPQVPISPPGMLTMGASPNERVAQGFGALGDRVYSQGEFNPLDAAAVNSPRDQRDFNMIDAAARYTPQVPMPRARPEQSPVSEPEMGFFARNAAMMRDPLTGDFIDPTAAAKAVRGPDLISKMMTYLHNKDIG